MREGNYIPTDAEVKDFAELIMDEIRWDHAAGYRPASTQYTVKMANLWGMTCESRVGVMDVVEADNAEELQAIGYREND